MAQLVKIGNSQGVRIPKHIVEQTSLVGKQLEFQVVDDGLLITPEKKRRAGWRQSIEKTVADQGEEQLDTQWLDFSLQSDKDLEW